MLTYVYESLKNEMAISDGEAKIEWDFNYNKKIQKIYHEHGNTHYINGLVIQQVLGESIGVKLESEDIWPSPRMME